MKKYLMAMLSLLVGIGIGWILNRQDYPDSYREFDTSRTRKLIVTHPYGEGGERRKTSLTVIRIKSDDKLSLVGPDQYGDKVAWGLTLFNETGDEGIQLFAVEESSEDVYGTTK